MTLLRLHRAYRPRYVAERLADAAFYGFAASAVALLVASRVVDLPDTPQSRVWIGATCAVIAVIVALAVLVRR